jgi:transposase
MFPFFYDTSEHTEDFVLGSFDREFSALSNYICFRLIYFLFTSKIMKSEDVRKIVLRLHDQGLNCRKIMQHLGGEVSKTTVNRWIKMFKESGEINLKSPTGRKRSKRTKRLIKQVKVHLLRAKRKMSTRKLAKVHNVSRSTMQRLIKDDLGYKSYIKRVAPKLTDSQKQKRFSFGIWVRKNVTKSLSKKILFSDEKRFDIDGFYNRQNDRIWAPNREQADADGGIHRKTKFPQSIMVWLGACYSGVTRPVIIEEGTINHQQYIRKILPLALQDGQKLMGDEFTFQQDGAPAHKDHHTQTWCKDNFWNFWPSSRWPPNSPDLNPLDYSIWYELCSQMKWEKIKNKKTLIDEIRAGVKKIRQEVVRRSIDSWTKRIYRMLQKRCEYSF